MNGNGNTNVNLLVVLKIVRDICIKTSAEEIGFCSVAVQYFSMTLGAVQYCSVKKSYMQCRSAVFYGEVYFCILQYTAGILQYTASF